MAPSQTRLVISGITGEQAWKDRVDFWQDVYGQFQTVEWSIDTSLTSRRFQHDGNGQCLL